MKKLTGFLIPLAVSAFALVAALTLPPPALGDEKDAKPALSTAVEGKDAKTPEKAKDAPGKADDGAKEGKSSKDDKTKDAEPTVPAVVVPPPPPVPPAVPNFRAVPSAAASQVSVIGSLTDGRLEVKFSPYGASIHSIQTADYHRAVDTQDPYTVISALRVMDEMGNEPVWERPFSANAVVINGDRVYLYNQSWELTGPGRYRIVVVDRDDKPVLEILRTYSLGEGDAGYDLTCKTTFKNLSDKPLSLVWEQNTQGDVERERGPQGDPPTIVAGYYDLTYDPNKVKVYTDVSNFNRIKAIDEFQKPGPPAGQTVWPRDNKPKETKLLWLATSNRYFTAVVHRPIPIATGEDRATGAALDDLFEPRIDMRVGGYHEGKIDTRVLMMSLTSKPIGINPGATHDLDLCLYAGPRLKRILNAEPYSTLALGTHLVRYERGCSMCLFQGLADFLLGFLKLIHAIVFDWGFSIIVLVLVVRLLLHPITKRAQINMTRMSKQMATLQPELAKLKEKYKNDAARQQSEMMKLYREKGVSPMGFLGCLPMFLQMPIWVALYAMLWGAIELRHQPAFWGVFQLFGDWGFLRDLSVPDNFIKFADGGFDLPLCNLQITYSLNILPILMAVVFYFQQKMTTPPPTNEQMAQQQKMMKYMTLLFPVMFYAAPSGLTLYIMSSSLAGMVDSYFVRKHIKAEEEAGTLFQKKPAKPGGFFDRMQKMIEAKQAEMAKNAESQGKRPGGGKRKR